MKSMPAGGVSIPIMTQTDFHQTKDSFPNPPSPNSRSTGQQAYMPEGPPQNIYHRLDADVSESGLTVLDADEPHD